MKKVMNFREGHNISPRKSKQTSNYYTGYYQ